MNQKVIDILFSVLIFSLPFNFIPQIIRQVFLGGPFGHDLVVYPLLAGFIYTAYCQLKYHNIFYKWDTFRKFILFYLAFLLVSLVWGLFNYPYYDAILNGPADQIERLPAVLSILAKIGVSADEKNVLEVWLLLRPIKGLLLNVLYSFGGAYMIFCWYHEHKDRALLIFKKVVMLDLVIIAGYGIIDVCFQNGQMWAQNLLAICNPMLHIIKESGGWWPPLYWGAQIRSIFSEPSYFGIFMAFAFPVLWWEIAESGKQKKILFSLLTVILTFELFLTNARTAMFLFLGELVLLAIITLYRRNRKSLLNLAVILTGVVISFGGAMYFMGNLQVPVKVLGENALLATRKMQMSEAGDRGQQDSRPAGLTAKTFVDNSVLSVVDQSKAGGHAASNQTRFTIIKTNLTIGIEHPVLGVGTSLRTGYMYDKLKDNPGEEIRNNNNYIRKLGILRASYGDLGDFAKRFAETGFVGIIIFLIPPVWILYRMGTVILNRQHNCAEVISTVFIFISMVGMTVSGLGDNLDITYCYWFMLGMCYLVYCEW